MATPRKAPKTTRGRRFAADIMQGVEEIRAMVRDGAQPADRFVVRTVRPLAVRPPHAYSAAAVKRLRADLNVSQATFADLLGVSPVAVQGWEQGVRRPTPLARRLLDTIAADPAGWVERVACSA